ncbi:putative BAH domain, Agenet-like domain, Agenet domain, plant type [Helianthus anomalus]
MLRQMGSSRLLVAMSHGGASLDFPSIAQNDKTRESSELESDVPNNIQSQMIHGQNCTWSGESSVCSKKLKHYPAFIRDGTTVAVHSFALIKGEEENQHIGYVEDLYEDYSGHKMVKVRWFNSSEEVGGIPSHEVMITPHVEVVSAECIGGLATVLTPKHYQQCLAVVSQDFSDGVYMCSRQIKNNKVSSFPLCKLRGYSNQTIFSILNPPVIPQIPSNEEIPSPFEQKLKGVDDGRCCFGAGEEIEVLSCDSGLRGCWHRCKILKAKKKHLKVVYVDVEHVDGPGNIEEWIAACRVADPDKLGMRYLGRHTIRPWAPSCSNACYSIGDAVDAWWCNAWWEGVVVATPILAIDTFCVYFPGENRFEDCEKKNLRCSKDWVGNKWLEIQPKPNIDVLNLQTTVDTQALASSQKEEAPAK